MSAQRKQFDKQDIRPYESLTSLIHLYRGRDYKVILLLVCNCCWFRNIDFWWSLLETLQVAHACWQPRGIALVIKAKWIISSVQNGLDVLSSGKWCQSQNVAKTSRHILSYGTFNWIKYVRKWIINWVFVVNIITSIGISETRRVASSLDGELSFFCCDK